MKTSHGLLALALVLAGCAFSTETSPSGDSDGDSATTSDGGASGADSSGDDSDAAGDDSDGSTTGDDDDSDGGSTGGDDYPPFQPGTQVDIDSGTIEGESDGDLRIFRGVPFADPPIGTFRFADPQPVTPWEGVLDATEYRASCPQPEIPLFNQPAYGPGPLSEDCLHLNVWAYDDPTPKPVMVFIHGGAYVLGSGSASIYEGSDLARRGDVVVVTINYRLGALGFLATESLAAESGDDSAGNYGIKDQVAALDWVRRNISIFGGDPDNVTIFGESAGGISVCTLMGAPAADGLYHRAIIESGVSCAEVAEERDATLLSPSAIEQGEQMAEDLGCPPGIEQLNCLRSADVDDLVGAAALTGLLFGDTSSKQLPVSPNVDGVFIPQQPIQRLAAGEADVPLITGTNRDEGTLFFANIPIISRLDLRREIANFIGDEQLADQVVDAYPRSEYPIARNAFLDIVTDFGFACPNLGLARAAQEGAPVYLYEFQRVYPGLAAMGSFHALELAYVFGNFDALAIVPSAADFAVREEIQRAWTTFARTGSPTMSSGWNAFGDDEQSVAIIDDEPFLQTESQFRDGRCEALQQLGLAP